MRMTLETIIRPDNAGDTMQVGMTKDGRAALLVVCGSQRATIELDDEEALSGAHALIFAVLQLRGMRGAQAPSSLLVAPDGSAVGRG